MEKLVKNAIKCKLCGDVIESFYEHDFKYCKCGKCFVDGGLDFYCRCGGDLNNMINLREYVETPSGVFCLKNKDEIVAKFEFLEEKENDYDSLVKDFKLLKPELLPKGVDKDDFADSFESWIYRRISARCKCDWFDYKTNALLSLNDCYYIAHESDERRWDELSLYKNAWSDEIAKNSFLNNGFCVGNPALSPEFSTDGALPKCWVRDKNDDICLLKTNLGSSSQTLGDFLAWQVGKAFDLECVEYELVEHLDKGACKCKCFCDEKTGFAAIYRLLPNDDDIKDFAMMARELIGADYFDDMIVFDAIIANKDRHYGNFGFLVDNDTNEILRPSPIFDNGYCVFRNHPNMIKSLQNDALYEQNRTFGGSMEDALSIVGSDKHIKRLKNLYDFCFEKSDILDKDLLKIYENFVRNNARNIVRFLENK